MQPLNPVGFDPDIYTYFVSWNQDEQAFSATVAEFPSLRWNARRADTAIAELKVVVHETMVDLHKVGAAVPRPRPTVPTTAPIQSAPQYPGFPTFPMPSVNQSVNIRTGRGFVGTSHTFHLVMTVCTCGMWAPVWMVMSMMNGARNVRR